jgi:hypothetical protein
MNSRWKCRRPRRPVAKDIAGLVRIELIEEVRAGEDTVKVAPAELD